MYWLPCIIYSSRNWLVSRVTRCKYSKWTIEYRLKCRPDAALLQQLTMGNQNLLSNLDLLESYLVVIPSTFSVKRSI